MFIETTMEPTQPHKKDTPAIKEVLLKWGHFKRAKAILKILQVS